MLTYRMFPRTQGSLTNLLLFAKLDKFTQQKIVSETYERTVTAGDILIQQGDTGLAATISSHAFLRRMPYAICMLTGARALQQHRHAQGQHQGARRLLRRDLADVQLSSLGHRCRNDRRCRLGAGP